LKSFVAGGSLYTPDWALTMLPRPFSQLGRGPPVATFVHPLLDTESASRIFAS